MSTSRSNVTVSVSTSMLACPETTRMGLLPGGLFTSSTARPGQVKPLAGHASGNFDPVGAYSPACTGVHCKSELRPVAFEWVPPGHGVGVLVPSLGQQLEACFPGWYIPGTHSSHAPTPIALLAVPIGQELEDGGAARSHVFAVATGTAQAAGGAALGRDVGTGRARNTRGGARLDLELSVWLPVSGLWWPGPQRVSAASPAAAHVPPAGQVLQPRAQPEVRLRSKLDSPPGPKVPLGQSKGQPVKSRSARILRPASPGVEPGAHSPKSMVLVPLEMSTASLRVRLPAMKVLLKRVNLLSDKMI
eukprot:scaffold16850_cov58-Phaeocystis_antarctica.AAC.6